MMEFNLSDFKKESPSTTYENVNRLLEGKSEEPCDNLIKSAGDAENLDSYEKSVRLIIIDSLKSKEGVVEALLSNDLQQIRRALHCKWFFEDALLPAFYETNIFPKVSFSTRCKIINQLSKHIKNQEHAEQLFEHIKCTYGKDQAVILLPKCRSERISTFIHNEEPVFWDRVWRKLLMKIVPNHPEFVIKFLDDMCDKDSPLHRNISKCNKIFLYLAQNHPNLFIPFFDKHYSLISYLKFGDKLRRKLSPALPDIVLKSGRKLKLKMFNHGNKLFRDLDFQGKVKFLAKLISLKKELSFSCWIISGLSKVLEFIKFNSANERAKLLEAVFRQVFEENLWEQPDAWTLPLLELMPLEIREKCVFVLSNDKKYASSKWNSSMKMERSVADQLAYLLDCEQSIPKLKEMIKKASTDTDRKALLSEMARSCAINKDFQNLESVCKYIVNRHRNEDSSTIISFLKVVSGSFDSQKFNLNLWAVIEELLTMCILTDESACKIYEEMIRKCIFFRLRNSLDAKEQMKNLVKYLILYRHHKTLFLGFDLGDKYHSYMQSPYGDRYFYMYHDELIRVMNEGNLKKENLIFLCWTIISMLKKYNRHAKNKILSQDLKEFILHLDRFFENYNEEDYGYCSCILYRDICSAISKDPYLTEKYSHLYDKDRKSNLMYLLKKNPNNILDDLEQMLDISFKKSLRNRPIRSRKSRNKRLMMPKENIYIVKKILDFYDASERFKNFTLQEFKRSAVLTDKAPMRKSYTLILHSYFTDISTYQELVQDYIPKDKEIDYKNNSKEFVEIQTTVPKLIKNIQPQSKNFGLIFKFLSGDFLKYVLGSFNSACYKTPIQTVSSELKDKTNNPVSVKKAILRNIAVVCDLQEKIKFCNDLWETEKHDSIRTAIFKRIIDNFLDEPTDESFNAVKKCILESSEVTIEARAAFVSIPSRYQDGYADAIWTFADGITENDSLKNQIKNSLIKEFNMRNVNSLSDELCEKIITSEIFKDDSTVRINNFACCYLVLEPKSEFEFESEYKSVRGKLDMLLNLMLERKENRESIVSFLNCLERFLLEHQKINYEIFDVIVSSWPHIFARYELFDEFLILQYYKALYNVLKLEDSKDVLSVTIIFVNELKKIIQSTPGNQELVTIFSSTIRTFLDKIHKFEMPLDDILMIRQLITSPERQLAIIGILLLPNENLNESEPGELDDFISLDKKKNIKFIHRRLKNFEDDLVQIYYGRKFNLKKFNKH